MIDSFRFRITISHFSMFKFSVFVIFCFSSLTRRKIIVLLGMKLSSKTRKTVCMHQSSKSTHGFKIQGRGSLRFFKIVRGVSILGFITFLSTSFFENLNWGSYVITPFSVHESSSKQQWVYL
jgi:hypothetical protein